MKKALSIALILAILLPHLAKVGIWIEYKFNQDFISEVLCINKDRPMLNCDGKCYLSQKLKEAEATEQQSAPPTSQEKHDQVPSLAPATRPSPEYGASDQNSSYSPYRDSLYAFSLISDIFHPPKRSLI